MDILAHGLYGSAAFLKQSRRSYWSAFFWGVFPDLAAFGWFFPILIYRTLVQGAPWPSVEPPMPEIFPPAVPLIYSFSHSLIIFALVLIAAWFYFGRPVYELLAWALHILFDIPSHTQGFFPTPFLFPVSSFTVSGIPWAAPSFFFSYWGVLILLYIGLFISRRSRTRRGSGSDTGGAVSD